MVPARRLESFEPPRESRAGWTKAMENYYHKEINNSKAYSQLRPVGKTPSPKNRERNQPCGCGSGRKYKKCCLNRHPRETFLYFDMGRPVVVDSISISGRGDVRIWSGGRRVKPRMTTLSSGYPRAGKNHKITWQVPINSGEISLDYRAAIEDLDVLIVMDTNSRKLENGRYFAVSVAAEFSVEVENGWINLTEANSCQLRFEGDDPGLNEKIGWVEVLKVFRQAGHPRDHRDLRMGLLTDHDRGKLSKYNSRELPLLPNTSIYLQPNERLMYASAGATSDGPLNQLMSQVDRAAKKVLEASHSA